MEDMSGLEEDYLNTIESMKSEIETLKEQLSLYPADSEDEVENPETVRESLENSQQEIEDLYVEISDKKSRLAEIKAHEEWIINKHPLSEKILTLSKEIELRTHHLSQAQEKRMQKETQLLEVEKLKKVNMKLYSLVKRLIQADHANLDLKHQIAASEDQRKTMRLDYAKITTALGLEEKVRKRIKEMEVEVRSKSTAVEELRGKHTKVQKAIESTINNIENSVVKDIIRRCNELRGVRAYYAEQIENVKAEIQAVLNEIEETEKNPKKIPPAVANQNLRTEVKGLEASITERSKEIKEKEREKFQLNFHYEESLKVLAEVKAKIESLTVKKEVPLTVKTGPAEKKSVAPSPMNPKKLEAKRNSVLEILGKGMTEGMGQEVMKVLKGVGKPGQGLASKVLELNRSQFSQPKSIIMK